MKPYLALRPSPFTARFAGLAAAVLTLAAAQAETLEKFDRSFRVSPGGKLVVDVDFGALEVTSHAGNEVVIHVERKISRGSKEDETAFLADRPVVMTQDGDTLHIRSRSEKKESWSWKGKQRLEGKYTIAVPRQFNPELKTAGGGIEVQGIEGTLNLRTSGGSIEVQGGGGTLKGHTSGGSIQVKSFQGPVQVHTSGGNVQLENIVGAVEGNTSGGSVTASLSSLSDPVKLTTSGGNVTLRVPETTAFDLDASTSGGSAGCDLPMSRTGPKSRTHLQGAVNGGGKPVVLRTSGGNVWVKKS
ncbi:MAG: DUF4097 family beta strand repeat protein [Verrucomicrobiales bacterium]|nr:DUF4097 family beta strand repeat protein [Verrucomicrobiales bacterium]